MNPFKHANGNMLASIDVETTGSNPDVHDIFQVSVLPLDADLKWIKTIHPFYLNLKPLRPANIDFNAVSITKFKFMELMKYGVEPDYAADQFTDWVARLNLPLGKKLMPVWSNGAFDRGFLKEWLGPIYYSDCIHYHERDTQHQAIAINDRYALAGKALPFNRVGLNSLAAVLGIVNENPHDALSDSVTTAAVYKALLQFPSPDQIGDRLDKFVASPVPLDAPVLP